MIIDKLKRRHKKMLIWLTVAIVALVSIRLVLPYVVLHYANKALSNMNGYNGRIQDIDLSLFRGAYTIDSIYLNKVDTLTRKETPFFATKRLDLSIEWKALFHGAIVGELVFEHPTLIFTKDKVEPETLKNDSTDFKKLLDGFMPLQVNRLEINNGDIRYKDNGSTPPVDIVMKNTFILAQNLRNSYDSTVLLPALVTAKASVYGGNFDLNMKLNPLAESPTFDMNTELKDTHLTELNEFFQAYAKLDVNSGTFGMYTEVAAKDGKFEGYVKPLIQDLDILGKEDRSDNIFQKIWEGLAGAVGQVFRNQDEDQVATKISFRGDLKNPRTRVGEAVVIVLINAFVQALQPTIDNEIDIATLQQTDPEEGHKNFFQKLFNKKDKKEKSQ